MRILLFAGTTEGRQLAERLAALPVETTVSVATEYGLDLLRGLPANIRPRAGRMDAGAMADLIRTGRYDLAVDATHPYARVVSENIRIACDTAGVPCHRLSRAGGGHAGAIHVHSLESAAAVLADMPGNILLATGSSGLDAFTAIPDFPARVYPRVLPTHEALRACERWGYRRCNIIAMQGPFSRDLNRAMLEQYRVRIMVTKDGGEAGGFREKMLAAEDAGVSVVVIGRPDEADGRSLEDIFAAVRRGLEEEGCG